MSRSLRHGSCLCQAFGPAQVVRGYARNPALGLELAESPLLLRGATAAGGGKGACASY